MSWIPVRFTSLSRSGLYPDVTTVYVLERGQEHESHVVQRGTFFGRRKLQPQQQRGQDGLHLEHRELDPDAVPQPRAERHPRARVTAADGFGREVVRVELVRIVVVQRAGLQVQRPHHQRGAWKNRTRHARVVTTVRPKSVQRRRRAHGGGRSGVRSVWRTDFFFQNTSLADIKRSSRSLIG